MALLSYASLLERQPLSIIAVLCVLFSVLRLSGSRRRKRFPELNPKKPLEFSTQSRVNDFVSRSKEILIQGRLRYRDKPYRLNCDFGEVIVLPPQLIDEIRSHPSLNFAIPAVDDAHAYIPGFEPFGGNDNMPKLITKHLTKALSTLCTLTAVAPNHACSFMDIAKLTGSISQEATHGLKRLFTDSTNWHEIDPKIDIMRVVSQMSSRIFMGEDLCRDEEWVKASGDYTSAAFQLSDTIRAWPRNLRPVVHWFMPACWELRRKLATARQVLAPHIEKRNNLKQQAAQRGEKIRFDDSIEWFEQECNDGCDPALKQITLSLVAIHTTSDLLVQVMLDLAQHPELIEPLRSEVIEVLTTQGLKKTSLYNLKLMDSVFKESQRLKPAVLAPMRRLVTKDMELSDGTKLFKGEKIIADAAHMWDSSRYTEAERYDGYRFLRMRETAGQDKHAHLVSTSADHLGFGHGQHACPGRFFAANEVKIALIHLLLKYDWKLASGLRPQPIAFGMSILPDPEAKLLIRRRQEELDLEGLEVERQ
ncbi:hypothetical protein QQS21_004548 [Conoideocrella luteorostrata]|uniref:Cytochrome P450 monooxygenase n=1 Tax=Conoideocrella luteorostrata TaxID=1105319 RepID=A0AAJ0G1H5_9HYPO|nr:hypothetical protein QQS21_004548 [Conoideocrella luteorostrata]